MTNENFKKAMKAVDQRGLTDKQYVRLLELISARLYGTSGAGDNKEKASYYIDQAKSLLIK